MNLLTNWHDRNINDGGILLYIRDSITLNTLSNSESVEGVYVEIKIWKRKWLIGCSYNPQKNINSAQSIALGKHLVLFYSMFKNIRLEVLNTEPSHSTLLKELC